MISEFHTAIGQFINYRLGLEELEPERELYLAIPVLAYKRIERLPLLLRIIEKENIKLIIYDPNKKEIISWIK